jgi:hypothetical protein
MRPIGFSTGALAYGDFRHGLEILRHIQKGAVELSALRERELAPLVESLDSLDLGFFTYVSFHAPSKFEREHEKELIRLLREVAARGFPIILHPDAIHDVSAWRSFGSLLLIENMDKRKAIGRTERELSEVFAALPEVGLCFDMGHCRQVDPTMNESYLILRKFSDKLRQLHVSEVNSRSTHDALSQASICAFENVAHLIPVQVPVILESPVDSSRVPWEIEQARLALPVRPPALAVNSVG